MKKIIYFLFAALIVGSCKKARTCSCSMSGTTVKTTTPRSVGTASVQTSTSANTTERTYSGVTKTDMRRLENCNSRTINSNHTYTATALLDTVLVTEDIVEETTTEYDCSIK